MNSARTPKLYVSLILSVGMCQEGIAEREKTLLTGKQNINLCQNVKKRSENHPPLPEKCGLQYQPLSTLPVLKSQCQSLPMLPATIAKSQCQPMRDCQNPEVVVTINKYSLKQCDLSTLQDNEWLKDMVCTFVCTFVCMLTVIYNYRCSTAT